MKKIKILLFAALTAVSLSSAFGQAQVAIGIKGGLNFANVNTKPSSFGEAYNSRTGYHAGAFVLFKLTKIGIQPEFIFSQQGTTVKLNTTSADLNYSYFNIPVILKLYLAGGFNLQAGPQFGFLTAAKSVSGGTTVDVKNNFKGSDMSIGLGAGWDLPFGLTLDARYNLGVSDNNNSTNSGTSQAVKNQVFQLSAGFKLIKLGN